MKALSPKADRPRKPGLYFGLRLYGKQSWYPCRSIANLKLMGLWRSDAAFLFLPTPALREEKQ